MAGKPNIRSIRFSDELAELIDRQAGNSFTEKFENFITRCVWELSQKEAELTRIQKEIQQERKRREKLDRVIRSTQQSPDYRLKDLYNILSYLAGYEARRKLHTMLVPTLPLCNFQRWKYPSVGLRQLPLSAFFDLCLSFAQHIFCNSFSGFGIIARCVAALPPAILALANIPFAVCPVACCQGRFHLIYKFFIF